MTTQPHECGPDGNMKSAPQYICELAVWGQRLEARVAELEGTLAEREALFEKCIALWKQEEVMWKEREAELLATTGMKWAGTKPN